MRGFHRHMGQVGRRSHRGAPFMGAIWMIGIGVLMLGGHIFPGILVLIGVSLVLGAFWRASEPQGLEEMNRPTLPPVAQPAAQTPYRPVEYSRVPPAPVSPAPRMDLLPANCARCGGPVRTADVKWRGERFAACAYCGSNLIITPKPRG